MGDNLSGYFEQVSAPLEEIARNNPNLIPLLKLVRKGYEDVCHKVISEEKYKVAEASETIKKMKQEISLLKREQKLVQKEKENIEHEANRNYTLYKKTKEDNQDLQKLVKDYERTIQEIKKKDFDLIRKLDLDEYNLTSDDLRSDRNKKYTKGVEAKGHPLVPKLDFEKIYQWREQQDLDDGQEDECEEEEEEEELLTENEKYMPKGSELQSAASIERKKELEKRKEEIVTILNKTYADEDQDNDIQFEDFKEDEVLFHDVQPDFNTQK